MSPTLAVASPLRPLRTAPLKPPPAKYSFCLRCTDANRQANIETVALFISDLWAKFITLSEENRDHLRHNRYGISGSPPVNVAIECVEQFRCALKDAIVQELNNEIDKDFPNSPYLFRKVDLSTDYSPEKILLKVAKKFFKDSDLHRLFPCKSRTSICFNRKGTELEISVDLGGPRS